MKRSPYFFLYIYLQLNLRSYNEELRQHLMEARKELEQNNRELALKKQVFHKARPEAKQKPDSARTMTLMFFKCKRLTIVLRKMCL